MSRRAAIPKSSSSQTEPTAHPAQGVQLCLPLGACAEYGSSQPYFVLNLQAELGEVQPLGKLHGVHALLSPGTTPWPPSVTVRCCEL